MGLVLFCVFSAQQVAQRAEAGESLDAHLEDARAKLDRWYTTVVSSVACEQVKVELKISIDDPVAEILGAVRAQRVEMIVTATQARTGWQRAVFGSVTKGVLRQAPCPVFTLRAKHLDARIRVPPGRAAASVRQASAVPCGAAPPALAPSRSRRV